MASSSLERYLGFPVVVKTLHGSQGTGVFLSHDKRSFKDLMQLINSANTNMSIILQEFIKDSYGRDLRVFVVGGRVLGCMERIAADGSFKANFSQGGKVQKHEPNPEIVWLATESARVLGLDIAGIDLLFDGDRYRICEANSASGFEGFERATNINVAQEIFNYIKIRFNLA